MASAAALKKLRKKYHLGEFSKKGSRTRTRVRKKRRHKKIRKSTRLYAKNVPRGTFPSLPVMN